MAAEFAIRDGAQETEYGWVLPVGNGRVFGFKEHNWATDDLFTAEWLHTKGEVPRNQAHNLVYDLTEKLNGAVKNADDFMG